MIGYANIIGAVLGLPPPPEPTKAQRWFGAMAVVFYILAALGVPSVAVPYVVFHAAHATPEQFALVIGIGGPVIAGSFALFMAAGLICGELSIPKSRAS